MMMNINSVRSRGLRQCLKIQSQEPQRARPRHRTRLETTLGGDSARVVAPRHVRNDSDKRQADRASLSIAMAYRNSLSADVANIGAHNADRLADCYWQNGYRHHGSSGAAARSAMLPVDSRSR